MNRPSPRLALALFLAACGGDAATDGPDAAGGPDAATGGPDAAATCESPGSPTTPTPPTAQTPTSDYNVTLLDCTRTSLSLACEVGVEPQYEETIVGTKRRITANAIPDHDVGDFPNPGNPNAIAPQTLQFEMPLVPSGAGGPARYLGIARSGVLFDPGTAEVWNNDTAWRYEALRYETAPDYFGSDATNHPTALGLDCNFAHVQPTGAYHYHGVPTGAAGTAPSVRHVGWAADGAPVFARWGYELPDDPSSAVVELRSSYRLRSGARPSNGPPGDYDGTFVGDWEYVAGLGDLDACNGRTGRVTIDGELVETYHYVLTNTFPYIPRCTTYAADPSFEAGGGGPPACMPGQTMMCCGDGACDGPETPQNCAADC